MTTSYLWIWCDNTGIPPLDRRPGIHMYCVQRCCWTRTNRSII